METILKEDSILETRQILVEARRLYANKILIRPAGSGVGATFKLERGWMLYKIWDRALSLALLKRFRLMAGLSPEQLQPAEKAEIKILISGENLRVRFSFLHEADGDSLSISILPIYTCTSLARMNTLQRVHKDALLSISSALKPAGVIIINSPDERQRFRMIYAMLTDLTAQNLVALSIENDCYFECPTVKRIEQAPEEDYDLQHRIEEADIIAISTSYPWRLKECFKNASETLFIIGFNYKKTGTALEAVIESVPSRSQIADSLMAIWSGRRVDIICKRCGGKVEPMRGMKDTDVCKACDGYGRRKGDDLFEVLVIDNQFRKSLGSDLDMKSLYEEIERLTVKPKIEDQLNAGINDGHFFNQKPEIDNSNRYII